MTTFSHGSIVVVDFPSTSGQPGKRRPALVVFDSGDADVVIARLTTQSRKSSQDVVLKDWAGAGLRVRSTVRLHKVVTIEKALVTQTMGQLSVGDHAAVANVLSSMFGKW